MGPGSNLWRQVKLKTTKKMCNRFGSNKFKKKKMRRVFADNRTWSDCVCLCLPLESLMATFEFFYLKTQLH